MSRTIKNLYCLSILLGVIVFCSVVGEAKVISQASSSQICSVMDSFLTEKLLATGDRELDRLDVEETLNEIFERYLLSTENFDNSMSMLLMMAEILQQSTEKG